MNVGRSCNRSDYTNVSSSGLRLEQIAFSITSHPNIVIQHFVGLTSFENLLNAARPCRWWSPLIFEYLLFCSHETRFPQEFCST